MANVGIQISATDNTAPAFQSVSRSLSGIQESAAGISASLAGMGVGISVAGFLAYTKAAIDAIDALNDLKDATGSSIENISALQDIAARTGTSFDVVGSALVKLNKELSAAKPGNDTAIALNAIGLSVKELKNLDPAEAFRQIAVGLSGFADDGNKARLTQELFGKSLKEVAPLLKDVAEAGQLNATVTTAQADAAEAFNKQLFGIQANAAQSARTLANELLPTLQAIAAEFTASNNGASSYASTLGGALKVVLETVTILGFNVAFVFQAIGREIGAIAAQSVALAKGDIKGFKAISDAVIADGILARKELDALEKRILGVGSLTVNLGNNQSAAETARLARSSGTGRASIGDVLGDSTARTAAASAAAKALAEQNREIAEQSKLIAELAGLTGSFAKDWDRLSAAYKRGALSLQDLEQAQAQLLAKQPFAIKLAKDHADAVKDAAKAYDDAAKAYDKFLTAQLGKQATAEDALKKQLEENETIGLTVEALGELEAQRLRATAALLEQTAAQAASENASDALVASYYTQAADLRSLADAKLSGAAKRIANDSAKEAASEWKKASEKIESSITDALMRGFENGKGFAENLRDTIVNMFKTLVLRPIIQATVQGGLNAVGLGGPGGGGGSDLLGQAQSAKGIYDAINGGFTSLGASVTTGINTFATSAAGANLGLSTPTVFAGPSIGSSAGGYTANVATAGTSSVASAAGAAAALAAAAYIGSEVGKAIAGERQGVNGVNGSETGAIIGAIVGGPIGAAIGGVIGGSFDRVFGAGAVKLNEAGIRGTLSAGGGTSVNRFTTTQQSNSGFQQLLGNDYKIERKSTLDPELTRSLGLAAAVITATAKTYAEAIGLSASAVDGFSQAIDISLKDLTPEQSKEKIVKALAGFSDGLAESLIGTVTTTRVAIQAGRGNYDQGEDGGFRTVTTVGPSAFAKEGETASATLLRLATSLTAVNATFGSLKTSLLAVSLTGAGAASKIVDAFGGLDKFAASIGSYFDAFYDDIEKRANTVDSLVAGINKAGGNVNVADFGAGGALNSRSEYRALVEKAKTDFGADSPLYVALVQMSGAFASIVPAATLATASVTEVAASLGQALDKLRNPARTIDDIAKSIIGLEDAGKALNVQLLEAQGNTAGAAALQRALDTAGFTAAETALYDYNDALKAQITSATDAAAATEQLAQSIKSALSGLGDARFGLENQLLTLQGNTGEVASRTRTNDLSKLTEGITGQFEIDRITAAYDYNTGLKSQIEALQAAKIAAQESANAQAAAAADASRAAEQIRSAWQSVTDSIFAEVARIRALAGGDSAQSFASAQANFSITAAQAGAGNQDAAKALPELSKILLQLAETNATSLLQLRAIQGQTAGTLESIGNQFLGQFGLNIPRLAVGTNLVPNDMLAMLHKGEAVVPAAYNPATTNNNSGANNEALISEIRALRAEVASLRASSDTSAAASKTTADLLKRVTRGGDAMQTQVFV